MAEPETSLPKKYYSLSDLARSLSTQIQIAYPGSYWITAEISKLNYYPQSGHCYPQLVEKKDGKIIADMRGMIFKRDYEKIRRIFLDVSGREQIGRASCRERGDNAGVGGGFRGKTDRG